MKVLLVCVFCMLSLCLLTVDSNQILFQKYCIDETQPEVLPEMGEKSSGALVMNTKVQNGSWYQPDLNCSVTFTAEKDFLILLTFSNISLRNSSMDNLTVIYNSEESSVVLFGQQVCTNEDCVGLKFDSGNFNNLTLKFVSANVSIPQNVTGFRSHYTVYDLVNPKTGACRGKHKFLCDNGHCIWGQLVCDGHNNCGDRSDETKCIIPVPDTVWGIVVIVAAVVSVIVFVPLFCCLATYGTRSIVKSVTVANQATPLSPATECGEASGLLTSSDVMNNCWPGTSYDRSNSYSYGTAPTFEQPSGSDSRKFQSNSEVNQPQQSKFL